MHVGIMVTYSASCLSYVGHGGLFNMRGGYVALVNLVVRDVNKRCIDLGS
jgi:hypothetical protein